MVIKKALQVMLDYDVRKPSLQAFQS